MKTNTNPTVEAVASRPAFPIDPQEGACVPPRPGQGIDTLTYIATRLMAARVTSTPGALNHAEETAVLAVAGARALIAELLA